MAIVAFFCLMSIYFPLRWCRRSRTPSHWRPRDKINHHNSTQSTNLRPGSSVEWVGSVEKKQEMTRCKVHFKCILRKIWLRPRVQWKTKAWLFWANWKIICDLFFGGLFAKSTCGCSCEVQEYIKSFYLRPSRPLQFVVWQIASEVQLAETTWDTMFFCGQLLLDFVECYVFSNLHSRCTQKRWLFYVILAQTDQIEKILDRKAKKCRNREDRAKRATHFAKG